MSDWRQILAAEIARSSVAAVARRLGYARSTISLAHHDRYAGDTRHIEAKVMSVLSGSVTCPHLGRAIAPGVCTDVRTAPMPTSSPKDLRHWIACQTCPLNPDAKEPSNA